MATNSVPAASRRLAQIGFTTSNHLSAQSEALEVLHRAIPYDVGTFATVDPATVLWTSCALSGLERDPARERFMFENEYLQNDVLKIADLARSSLPTGRISALTQEQRARSARFQVITQYGAVDELRCAIVENGLCWGSFEIYRSAGLGIFSDDDVRTAASLVDSLAQMLRAILLRQSIGIRHDGEEGPGLVVLNQHGDVELSSPGSDVLLEDISDGGPFPPALRALAIRAGGSIQQPVTVALPRRSGGWMRVRVMQLDGDVTQKISIVLEPARPADLPKSIARIYGFTMRECDVIALLARGLSSKEIALGLAISAHTVNDHIKAVFRKSGVQSRQQLVASLFFDHCLPLRERDAVPGPYGWFIDPEMNLQPRAETGSD